MNWPKLPISIKFDANEWQRSREARRREQLRQVCTHTEYDGQELISLYKPIHHNQAGDIEGVGLGSPRTLLGLLLGWKCSCCGLYVSAAEEEPNPMMRWEGRHKEMMSRLKDQRRSRDRVFGKTKWPAVT